MSRKKNGLKQAFLSFISLIALIAIGWLIFFGQNKTKGLLEPLIKKVPKDEAEMVVYTDNFLSKLIKSFKGDNLKKVAGVSSDFFENSQYAGPGRDIRENVKNKVDEILQSLKELPAKEFQIIKMEIYKKWFSDIATQSAGQ